MKVSAGSLASPRSGRSSGHASTGRVKRVATTGDDYNKRRKPRLASSSSLKPQRSGRRRAGRNLLVVVLSKLVGLAVFLALGGLLYWVSSSPEFSASRVSVHGNRLLTTGELEAVASASGVNLFWLRPADLSQRLRLLPPIESANVSLELPDHVLIEVKERDPVAVWLVGDTPFLIDRDGLLLAARRAERPLTMIRDVSNQALGPGSRVSVGAVRNISALESLLAQTFGPQPRQYEYAHESGINVIQTIGPRLVIGATDELEWKIGAIQAIVRHLEANRVSAQLIDVRFADRPYFR